MVIKTLADAVPLFARRVLAVAQGGDSLSRAISARTGAEVWSLRTMPGGAEAGADHEEGNVPADTAWDALPFADGFFDCIAVIHLPDAPPLANGPEQGVCRALSLLARYMQPDGYFLITHSALSLVTGAQTEAALEDQSLQQTAARAGLLAYLKWGYSRTLGGRPLGFTLVQQAYNPVDHARRLRNAGHPEWALDVLQQVPIDALSLQDARTAVHVERLYTLVLVDARNSSEGRLGRLFEAQKLFTLIVRQAPGAAVAYECMAEMWRRLGDSQMAAGLLDTASALNTPGARRTAAKILEQAAARHAAASVVSAPAPAPPPSPHIDVSAGPLRVLFITHPRPHYGLDVLWSGLCHLLGEENVIEFPWKPPLHGAAPEHLEHYPCSFAYPGRPREFEEIVRQLEEKYFELVVYGDFEKCLEHGAAQRLITAAAGTPIALLDQQDEPLNYFPDMVRFLGLPAQPAAFKREYIACADYGAKTFPLPFAYPDEAVAAVYPAHRPNPLFWAGHRRYGLRGVYLERVEQMTGAKFNKHYDQASYRKLLRLSQVGLNFFGFGYDTVRYWELPAHGALLLSERPPISIPHNFIEGESAAFFSSLPELEEQLAYYLAHPEKTAKAARAGYAHLRTRHTASARARQMLERWMSVQTGGG